MKIIDGGVTSPKGFKAASAAAGIKYQGRDDMALVVSECPAIAAGTFTTNVVKAAPVRWDMDILEKYESVKAVVLNSGIANACTGVVGDENNEYMAQVVADELSVKKEEILTASTGVIGMQLSKEPLAKGAKLLVSELGDDYEHGVKAAKAIMTTDTVMKQVAVTFTVDGKEITIGGMSKGSGMIHPNMATMLGVVTTDLNITKEMLTKAVKADVKDSFNMISVDRDTSTNDSLMVLANGLAGNKVIDSEGADFDAFKEALAMVTHNLAKKMASDGEGATKLIESRVVGAVNDDEARILAKSVITSNLVKSAVFGSDANWGRIVCALGYSGVEFNPDNVDLYIEANGETLKIFENGMATDYLEEDAARIFAAQEVITIADMKQGEGKATAWGCDLTYDYVKINGDYRS